MKFALTCPRKEWVKENPQARGAIDRMLALGFVLVERDVPGATLVSCGDPVMVELETMADLMELQQRVGDRLVIDEGVIEIGS